MQANQDLGQFPHILSAFPKHAHQASSKHRQTDREIMAPFKTAGKIVFELVYATIGLP